MKTNLLSHLFRWLLLVVLPFSLPLWSLAQDHEVNLTLTQNLGSDECFKVLVDDFNRDGQNDLLVINFKASSKIWLNRGDGSWAVSGITFGSGGNHDGALGDLDGDGDRDLVIVSTMSRDQVWMNDGDGSFTLKQNLGGQMDLTVQCQLGDVDGDGDLDLVTGHTFNPNKIWINDGTGTFQFKSLLGSSASYYMDLADVDLDGDLDLFMELNDAKDQIWMNDGLGNFSASDLALGFDSGSGHGIFIEWNKDTFPDLFLPNDVNGSQLYINDGHGQFSSILEPFGNGNVAGILDADSDGDRDVILSKMDGATQLFLNFGDAGFRAWGQQFVDEKCWSISCYDLEGDGDTDVILGNSGMGTSETKLFMNMNMTLTSKVLNHTSYYLNVLPNLSSGVLQCNLGLSRTGPYVLEVFDLQGKVYARHEYLHQSEVVENKLITFQGIPAGHYLLSLRWHRKQLVTKQIIII